MSLPKNPDILFTHGPASYLGCKAMTGGRRAGQPSEQDIQFHSNNDFIVIWMTTQRRSKGFEQLVNVLQGCDIILLQSDGRNKKKTPYFMYIKGLLDGGFKYFIFSPLPGQIVEFQRG